MDCEKFDQHVIDALYDELDELTYAALKRHVEGCSRCSGVFSGLRATREVGVLPLVEPAADLEDRILEAAFAAQKRTPLPRKVLRGLAWAGSHAMRPQLAMAALFFLVIGSSLLLLRAPKGTVNVPFRVTEHGAPAPDEEAAAPPAPAGTAAAPAELPAPLQAVAAAPEPAADAKKPDEAQAESNKAGGKGDRAGDAKAALAEARAARDRSGCGAAVSKFDEVGARFPATAVAADAMWEEASCYKSMGQTAKARELLLALKANAAYRDRVEQELAADANANPVQNQMASRARNVAAPPPAAAPTAPQAAAPPPPQALASASPESPAPRPKAAAKPATSTGSSGKAVASPPKPADAYGY